MGTFWERPTRQWVLETRRVRPPLVWKSHKLKQGCTSTLGCEAKELSSGLGHLEWVMCMFATVLFPALCLEKQGHVHSAILSHQRHRLQERV